MRSSREHALSRRERDTLEQLLTGAAEKEVAARLGLSAHTVHSYVKSLYRKLGVSSRAELMVRCLTAAVRELKEVRSMVVVTHYPVVPRFWLLGRTASICMVFAMEPLIHTVHTSVPDVVIVPAGLLSREQAAHLRRAMPEHGLLLLAAEGADAGDEAGAFDGVLAADALERDLSRVLDARDAAAAGALA